MYTEALKILNKWMVLEKKISYWVTMPLSDLRNT